MPIAFMRGWDGKLLPDLSSWKQDSLLSLCIQNHATPHGQSSILFALPGFSIKTTYDLVPTFKGLGLVKEFDPSQSDFHGMHDSDDVSISQIVHKAALAVDELGSVAVAVTSNEVALTSGSMNAPVVHFDRPFMVMIRENTTNSTLFMGRISDPTAQ